MPGMYPLPAAKQNLTPTLTWCWSFPSCSGAIIWTQKAALRWFNLCVWTLGPQPFEVPFKVINHCQLTEKLRNKHVLCTVIWVDYFFYYLMCMLHSHEWCFLFDLLKGLVFSISTNGTEVWLETPAGGQRVGLGFFDMLWEKALEEIVESWGPEPSASSQLTYSVLNSTSCFDSASLEHFSNFVFVHL